MIEPTDIQTEVEVQEPDVQTVVQEESLLPPSTTTNTTAQTFASAVSIAMGIPEQEEFIAQQYEDSGQSMMWETNKQLWQEQRAEASRTDVVNNIINRSARLGVDPVAELQGGGIGLRTLAEKEERANVAGATESPEEDAMRYRLRNELNPDIVSATDIYQKHGYMTIREEKEANNNERAMMHKEAMEYATGLSNEGGFEAAKDWHDAENVAGFAVSVLPGAMPLPWIAAAGGFAEREGIEINNRMAPGTIKSDFRKHIATLDIDQAQDFTYRFIDYLWTESDLTLTDFQRMSMLNGIVNDKTLIQGMTQDQLGDVIENGVAILDATFLAPIAKVIAKVASPGVRYGNAAAGVIKSANKKELATKLEVSLHDEQVAKTLGIDNVDAARTQIPSSPRAVTEDLPEALIEEAARVAAVRAELRATIEGAEAGVYRATDVDTVVAREAKATEQAWSGRVRPGMSSTERLADNSGVTFNTVIGRNKTAGFGTYKTAFNQVDDLIAKGMAPEDIAVHSSDGSNLTKLMTGNEALAARAEDALMVNRKGNFYVSYKQDYKMRPSDRGIFHPNVVTTPEWMGGTAGWLTTPSAHLSREIYEPFVAATLTESSISHALGRITQPIFKMGTKTRREIDKMWTFTEDFARTNRRAPTQKEYKEAFPDSGADEMKGVYLTKEYYDTLYDINNASLYRDWNGRGFKTLRSPTDDVTYHGKPMTADDLAADFADSATVEILDPNTLKMVTVNKKQADDLLKDGGSILKTDLKVQTKKGEYATYILQRGSDDPWKVTPLSRSPLTYIEGYYPRIYKDSHYITEIVQGAKVNGKVQKDMTRVVAVAGTKKEAARFIAAKVADGADEALFKIADDSRLSAKDKTALDMERKQVEGSLFFDNRLETNLPAASGGLAENISPTNMLMRSASMVSRDVALTNVTASMKSSFQATYKELVGDISGKSSSIVSKELTDIIGSSSGAKKVMAQDAKNVWDYVSMMEGNTAGTFGAQSFRNKAINGAEALAEVLTKSGTRESGLAKYLTENAGQLSPISMMKSLAFFDYIVTRPARQLALQASQHMFIAALDPAYLGRWQRDSYRLLQGMKKEAAELGGGKKVSKAMYKRNAKAMGLSEQEYRILVKEFDRSGIPTSVDIHSFAGDVGQGLKHTPDSVVGDMAQKAGRVLSAAPARELAKKWGFDLGEQFNLTAAYTMALRKHRKANGIENLTKMTKDDWDAVTVKASDYALTMNKANAAKFQHGALSVPTQFLSFAHKTLLTGLRATGSNAGNKAFTVAEARRIVAGQMLLFGGAGFGLKEAVERGLYEVGGADLVGTEAADLLMSGAVDYIMDSSMAFIADDTETDLTWSTTFAPGGNIANTVLSAMQAVVFDGISVTDVFGASGSTIGRVGDGFSLANTIMTMDTNTPTAERWALSADAIGRGLSTGWSDISKWNYARKYGHWQSTRGTNSNYEATTLAMYAKLGLGVNQANGALNYRLWKAQANVEEQLKATAKNYHAQLHIITGRLGDGTINEAEFHEQLAFQKMAVEGLEPWEQAVVMREFTNMEKYFTGTDESVVDMLSRYVSKGGEVATYLEAGLLNLPGLSDEDRRMILEVDAMQKASATLDGPAINDNIDEQLIQAKKGQ